MGFPAGHLRNLPAKTRTKFTAMHYLMPLLLLALLAWTALGPKFRAWQDRRRYAVDIANVRLIQGPRLVASEWEGDSTVYERAAALRGLVALSESTWITTDDIIVRVYHPHSGDGKTLLDFATWRSMVLQEFAAISAKHYTKVSGLGNAAFDAALNGQRSNLNTL